jgi:tRNA (Thr-GGU) A37 N-methylase
VNLRHCDVCGRERPQNLTWQVDEEIICARCLYGDADPFRVYPIGVVRNQLTRTECGFGTKGVGQVSRIQLLPSQKRFMYRLEDEDRLTVVYYLHRARPVRSVFRRGVDGKAVGVFASRTPDRLSRIAVQEVRLVRVEETTLYVEGLDAIDGSPVLDIKLGRN